MSAQSIIVKSIKSIKEEAEKNILKNAKKYLLKEDYLLGKGHCSFSTMDSFKTLNIIDKNNCNLNNSIEAVLENFQGEEYNKEEILTNNPSINNKKESSLYELWKAKGNSGSKDDFLNQITSDTKADWDEIDWD